MPSGSITQWILACKCDAPGGTQDQPEEELRPLCQRCGKPIGTGRSGTLTQWIFGSGCGCPPIAQAEPLPVEVTAGDEDDADPELARSLKEDLFPLNRYKPISLLGSGTSGAVYLCRDIVLDKKVAVKTLHQRSAAELVYFQQEAKATSNLQHKNLVALLDFGITDGGAPFMILDYVPGIGLDKLRRQAGTLPWQQVTRIMIQLCDALVYLHEHGIFHRDLKPGNILVHHIDSTKPDVWLIDFGIAGRSEEIVGTPAYMSPDQFTGEPYSEASEIYALGCIMFECLSGRLPFVCDTALDTMRAHATSPVPSIDAINSAAAVPEPLLDIVSTCLCKAPGERYGSASQLRDALQSTLAAESSSGDDQAIMPANLSPQAPLGLPRQRITTKSLFAATIILVAILAPTLIVMRTNTAPMPNYEPKPEAPAKTPRPLKTVEHKEKAEPRQLASIFQLSRHHAQMGCTALVPDLQDGEMKLLRSMPITNLSLGKQPELTDACCDDIASLPLINMDVSYTKITDAGFSKIAKVKSLRAISWMNCRLTGSSLRYLSRNLNSVVLEKSRINNAGLAGLEDMKLKGYVNLAFTDITDQGLQHLSRLNSPAIRMTGCQISDAGLAALKDNRWIQQLSIEQTLVGKNGLQSISRMPLVLLSLSRCKHIDDTCIDVIIQQWPNLNSLSLESTSVTAEGLKRLSALKKLAHLNIRCLPLQDKDLSFALKLKQLESLDLTETLITDKTLQELESLPHLKKLSVNFCDNVTESGITRAKKQFQLQATYAGLELKKELPRAVGQSPVELPGAPVVPDW